MRRPWAFIVSLSRLGGTTVAVPDREGIEWTLPANRLHFALPLNRMHYTLPVNRVHWDFEDQD